MGLILHELSGRVTYDTATVADATLGADVHISPVTPAPLLLDLDFLAEVPQQYQPRGQVVQRPYMRVTIDNFTPLSAIEMKDFTGPFSIERTLTSGTQWSMQVAIGEEQAGVLSLPDRAASNMPVELELKAPPPALAEINVYGGYWLTDGTAFEQLLMSDGISASSNRKYSFSGHVLDIQGIGPEGRWDRALASLDLPPDHGYTHGDLIQALAVYVGVPLQNLAIAGAGSPRQKALNVCRENWWALARDISEAAILVPYWDRSGVLTLPSLFGDQDGLPNFVFTEMDIMADAGIDIQSEADVPTCITVQGTSRVDSTSGTRTTATFVETFKDYAIPRASHTQSSTGVVSSRGVNSPSPTFQLVSRTSIIDEIQNDCLVVRNTYVEGWYNPQLWKWTQDTSGAPLASGYNDDGFMFLEDSSDGLTAPVAGDGTPIRWWSNYKWSEIAGERLYFPRWSENSNIHNPAQPGPIGYKLASITAKRGWFIPEHAIKTRTGSSTTWEATSFINNRRMMADGRAVGGTTGYKDREHYLPGPAYKLGELGFALNGIVEPKGFYVPGLSPGGHHTWIDTAVTRYVVDACGFILRDSTYNTVPSVDPDFTAAGDQYLFKSGSIGGGDNFGRIINGTVTDYVALGEQSKRAISTKYENGQVTEVVVTDDDGYLPAADSCGLDQEDNVQDIEAKVCSLEEVHEQYEDTVQNDFIESVDEAKSLAEAMLRDAQAVRISFQLSAVWALEPGMKVQIHMPRARISHSCIVERVRWYRSQPGGPILTAVVGKILVS